MSEGLPPPNLPPSGQVNVQLLGEAFESFTSSYKILIMRVILQEIDNKPATENIEIGRSELLRGMLSHAWFPSQHFNLEFGKGDYIAYVFHNLTRDQILMKSSRLTINKVRSLLDKRATALESRDDVDKLLRHPPYLIIKPWFKDDIPKGPPEKHYNLIAKLSNTHFDEKQPLYRLEQPSNRMIVHPHWVKYLKDNMHIVEGWLDSKWLSFLESKNPNVPTLSSKLWNQPGARQSLIRQRSFWDSFIDRHGKITCIYSRSPVPEEYVLDHFLPRSWVGHDQIWNLIPTSEIINRDKSDGLPDSELIAKLANAHYQALGVAQATKPSGWERMVDEYCLGLRIAEKELHNQSQLLDAYQGTVQPMLALAGRQGFPAWKWSKQS